MKKSVISFIILSIVILIVPISGYAQASNGEKINYKVETERILNDAENKFHNREINKGKNSVLAANYFASLKKAVKYASALSIYSGHIDKIKWEKDRKLRECQEQPDGCGNIQKKEIESEMGAFEDNVLTDIDTFRDGIIDALYNCKDATESFGLDSITDYDPLSDKFLKYFEKSADFKEYKINQKKFKQGFSKEADSLEKELAQWTHKEQPKTFPDDPIVDPDIANKL